MNNPPKKKADELRQYCLVNLDTHVILKREAKIPLRVATLNSVLSRQRSTLTWIVSDAIPADYSERSKS